MKLRSFINLFAAALLAFAPPAMAAFDPVNDDTDIFLANPNVPAERPNVLIILDNTANWNAPFSNEKAALVSVVNGLDDRFNVGLMMFPETGGGNDTVDGGYVRFHVRQMTSTNKTALATMVNNLDQLGDKGNNATTGLAMYEAYLYFAGKASRASFGKVKTDFAGNTANNSLAAPLSGHALPAPVAPATQPASTDLYTSPITNSCQKNFIIYISNGPANENAAARATLEGFLATLTGVSPPATISITPSGQQADWADETAKFIANADVNAALPGVQNVITYTVEVDPGTVGGGPDMTALLKSMAVNGKGKYFGVTSGGTGTSIVNALNQIFTEVQAVNSVFAATTLPVSVNVRGTNLNQVYIGVFRPDPFKAPRWLGNLKLYNLALDTTTNTVFLADATNGVPPAVGNPAQNAATGFISGNASSFWTAASTFWSFRDPSQNGVGGASDKPDGDLVEKGGVAQQIRTEFALAEASTPSPRRVHTCTTGCNACTVSGLTCTGGTALSTTPFNTTNTDLTDTVFGLSNVQTVTALTAFVSQTVTSLSDRRTVGSITNAASPVTVTLTNGAVNTQTISSLTNLGTAKTLTALTGATSLLTISNISYTKGTGGVLDVITVTTTTAHGFVATDTVVIAGTSKYNGTYTVNSVISTTQFSIQSTINPSPATESTGTASPTTTTALATTSVAHGLSVGDVVLIAGATSTAFNGNFTVTAVPSTTTFNYTLPSRQGVASLTAATVTPRLATVTATTSVNHGFVTGQQVTISGANPAGYNGAFTIASVPALNSFTYITSPAVPQDNIGSPVTVTSGSSTTVTATSTLAHGFSNGQAVSITGATPSNYNGTYVISTAGATSTTFTFNTTSILAPATGTAIASSGTTAIVTVTLTNHGFNAGDSVTIAGASPAAHNGTFTVLAVPVPTASAFSYSTVSALAAPTGTITVQSVPVKAYATVTNHGYLSGDSVTIKGATPTAYNGAFTITKIDANTFSYALGSSPGPASGGTITANKPGTTATATVPAHGFSAGQTVTVAGANETAFNGSITIGTVPTPSTFTYPVSPAQGDATGSITVTAASTGSNKDVLIKWIRGQDNLEDENANTSLTDIRASVHGDVLHSRPAVINYNRFGSNNDVYVYYGANDGIFHAVKGGYATDASDPDAIQPGHEAWGFIPKEFFGKLKRIRDNTPRLSSAAKKPYFADGPIGVLTKDTNNNGKLGDTGDIVNLYIATRRGGQFIYALDVNNPTNPKFLWNITNGTTGFSELGFTWSEPKVVSGINGYSNPVLIFGAGYDPTVDDLDPCTITATTATTVTASVGGTVSSSSTTGCTVTGGTPTTFTRTMGRGIFVVDAVTGALVWHARTSNGAPLGTPACATLSTTAPTTTPTTCTVSGMDFSIPSDIAVINNLSGGPINRAYVGDTGGNLWRIDLRPNPGVTGANLAGTLVTKIASIADQSAPIGMRKFLFPPDVVGQTGFDALLIGSGDREHPFDTGVTNRFYMFKDKGPDAGPITGTTGTSAPNPTIVESALFDATLNCIQDVSGCVGQQAGLFGQAGGQSSQLAARSALGNASGWFITLGSGEKVVSTAVSLAGTVFFNTNQPQTVASTGTCGSNLGVARQYQISVKDATATSDLNASGSVTGADRSLIAAGGGYLPSPVHVVVTLGGKPVEAIISGVLVSTPPGASLQSRLRKYWYKEID